MTRADARPNSNSEMSVVHTYSIRPHRRGYRGAGTPTRQDTVSVSERVSRTVRVPRPHHGLRLPSAPGVLSTDERLTRGDALSLHAGSPWNTDQTSNVLVRGAGCCCWTC